MPLIADEDVPSISNVEVASTDPLLAADGDIICGLPLSEYLPHSLDDTDEVTDIDATLDSSGIPSYSPNVVLSSDAQVPVLSRKSLLFRQRAEENPDAIHLVPHMDGVDQQSDDEESFINSQMEITANHKHYSTVSHAHGPSRANQNWPSTRNGRLAGATRNITDINYGSRSSSYNNPAARNQWSDVFPAERGASTAHNQWSDVFPAEQGASAVKVEQVEQVDDMFASHLQKIEEDENDYLLDHNQYNTSCATPGTGDNSAEGKPLFAMSMILKDAGLSPQYLKAGTNHFGEFQVRKSAIRSESSGNLSSSNLDSKTFFFSVAYWLGDLGIIIIIIYAYYSKYCTAKMNQIELNWIPVELNLH